MRLGPRRAPARPASNRGGACDPRGVRDGMAGDRCRGSPGRSDGPGGSDD